MHKINNQTKSLHNIELFQDITSEAAEAYSGGSTVNGLADVTLFSEPGRGGVSLKTNEKIEDLSDFDFDNLTQSITVENGQTWRFYEDPNFEGDYIEVGPFTTTSAGDLAMEISSLQAIS
ncbi:beta/gamma crystallin-related protein [Pleurocapsa sp. PCC 7319]|uniref:beta/gamma crystallin-related protein n=1 Tax=Pleurocapsa sp. PCC 7319 TaxID=118161 RepID=UPI00034CB4D8|nr:beta/gamma crystallin-related protein [Pleurocapsa sp. PCC 7319]